MATFLVAGAEWKRWKAHKTKSAAGHFDKRKRRVELLQDCSPQAAATAQSLLLIWCAALQALSALMQLALMVLSYLRQAMLACITITTK